MTEKTRIQKRYAYNDQCCWQTSQY